MDGLSAATTIIAVIQVSVQVYDVCRTYYMEVRDARKDIQSLRDEVMSLQDVLINLRDLAEDSVSADLSSLTLVSQENGPLQQCQRDLEELVAKLNPGQGKNTMRQYGLRALKWPFTSKDVDKVLVTIGRHKATFNLVLAADNVYGSRYSHDFTSLTFHHQWAFSSHQGRDS